MRSPRSLAAAFCLFSATGLLGRGQARRVADVPAGETASLPITSVSLYKNGVGLFEHTGRVTGNATVTIDLTSAQLNDVLQTLTAVDLQGGRIAGAGYNSPTPLDQQLKSFPLPLGEDASSTDFYNAIRGARIEVRAPGLTIVGRLLSIEIRTAPGKDSGSPGVEKRFLTVASDAGAVRTVELTQSTEVRLLDANLNRDLTRYLQLIASTRSGGLRRLALQDNGVGSRELRVSYISEVPIWKSTYRILFTEPKDAGAKQTATMQGWSVVDNTTGSDWVNVKLSLVAGAPQSFIQPISTPYYARRPKIPLPQEAQLTPQTHESGEESNDGLAAPTKMPKDIRMFKEDGAPPPAVAGVAGMGSMGGSAGGVMGPAPMRMSYENAASLSVAPDTTTRAFDDFFAYRVTQPLTIRKNESALVPILQTKVNAERVTLWSPRQPRALRALWLTNSSTMTLDGGSFSIMEDGAFGGEGLLETIHPGEKRLVSYAADQAVHVNVDYQSNTRRTLHVTVAKGVLKETTAQIAEVEYIVHNAAPEPRMVVVEQPRRSGWTLDSDPKPSETTATAYRFRVATGAGESVRLHIGERHTNEQVFSLSDTPEDQLTVILRDANASPALLQKMEPVFAARRALDTLDKEILARQESITQITADQKRVRDNLGALKGSTEERALMKRYVDELNAQEDQLNALKKELAGLREQRAEARRQLDQTIESLTLDDAVQG